MNFMVSNYAEIPVCTMQYYTHTHTVHTHENKKARYPGPGDGLMYKWMSGQGRRRFGGLLRKPSRELAVMSIQLGSTFGGPAAEIGRLFIVLAWQLQQVTQTGY